MPIPFLSRFRTIFIQARYKNASQKSTSSLADQWQQPHQQDSYNQQLISILLLFEEGVTRMALTLLGEEKARFVHLKRYAIIVNWKNKITPGLNR